MLACAGKNYLTEEDFEVLLQVRPSKGALIRLGVCCSLLPPQLGHWGQETLDVGGGGGGGAGGGGRLSF